MALVVVLKERQKMLLKNLKISKIDKKSKRAAKEKKISNTWRMYRSSCDKLATSVDLSNRSANSKAEDVTAKVSWILIYWHFDDSAIDLYH